MSTAATHTILIAEDSKPNRIVLNHLLKQMEFQTIEVENGRQAIEVLRNSKTNGTIIDLVISDMMMPEISGIELLQFVRKDAHYKTLPFLLISALSDRAPIMAAKEFEVNGYILKPVTYLRVVKKMQEIFPQKLFPKVAG